MSPALVIFKKDVRHLWPQIALWIAMLAFTAITDPFGDSYAPLLAALAAAYLIVTVIQDEALPGDRQYWRTRPFHWHELLRAKWLFIIAFFNAPVLLTHAAILGAHGIPVIEHLTTLFWFQFFLGALILLPAAVLGAVTNGLTQAMLFGLFGFAALAWISSIIYNPPHAGHQWIGTVPMAGIAAGAGIAMLALQYCCRYTTVARIVFIVVAIIPAIQLPVATRPPVPPAQRVTLDPATAHTIGARSGVELRIHIDGVPAGAEPITNQVHIGQINKYGGRLSTLEAAIHDFANGAGWLTIYDSRKFFAPWTAGVPVTGYIGDLNVVLFAQPRAFPVPLTHPVVIPGIGVCSKRKADFGLLDIVCLTPYPRASLALESADGRKQWIISYIPTIFAPLQRFITPLALRPDELSAARLITGQLLGQRHLTFDLPNLQLDLPQ